MTAHLIIAKKKKKKYIAREAIKITQDPFDARLRCENLSHKKRWIAYATNIMGTVIVNKGAKEAIINHQKSLLSIGIVSVEGKFKKGEIVSIKDNENQEFARGSKS